MTSAGKKPSATTSVRPSGKDSLSIMVKASPQASPKTWTLTCDPVGGDHPESKKACAALEKTKKPFKPVPADKMCTKIYGGPAIATVKGTWQNQRVNAKFSRKNGCELHRWTEIAPLFGNLPKVG